jgi:N-acetylmuramoyl-L-alanine amidase
VATLPLPAPPAAVAAVVQPLPDADVGPAPMPRTPGLARIQAIRRTVLPDVVRIAIELDQEVEYRYERIDGPVRVFLDLAATEVAPNVAATMPFDDSVVKSVRLGPRPARSTRVVLDLEGAGRHTVFTLYNPYRIVVDIDRRTGTQPAVVAALNTAPAPPPVLKASAPLTRASAPAVAPAPVPVPLPLPLPLPLPDAPTERVRVAADEDVRPAPPVAPAPDEMPAATPLPGRRAALGASSALPAPAAPSANVEGRFSMSRQLGLGINRIVIDPGHGGHDPGTKSRGLSEAELVVDVARRLEALLLKEPGVEVVLTRRTDVFVPLEERTAIANREGADLFLSIPPNSSRTNKAGGVET